MYTLFRNANNNSMYNYEKDREEEKERYELIDESHDAYLVEKIIMNILK